MAKRFRKVYIVCEDNKIFASLSNIPVYNSRDNAELACKRKQQNAIEEKTKMWNVNNPPPKFTVHGCWLLHEDLFTV